MRLLFVSHSFPPPGRPLANVGGMQRVATELHAALRQHAAVELDSLALRTSWTWTHVRTGPFLLTSLSTIRHRARRDAMDAVLFSSMVTAALSPLLQKPLAARGIPMAAIAHGRDVTLPFGPYQRLVPRVFAALDAVMPVSHATGQACMQRGLAAGKLHVISNGVNTHRFPPLDDRAAMRRALVQTLGDPAHPLPEDALLLCSVGRQVPRKGFAWFVNDVLPRLPEDVHYWLAGDGPEAAAITDAVTRSGFRSRVRLLGRVSEDDLLKLYRGADVFVMPNIPVPGDMEGFGVVMLEAGMAGLPVIAARLEGIQDVITEGLNGHLVASGDAEGFAASILHYYNNRPALAAAARHAHDHTAATFSWQAVANQYVEVLRALAAS